MGHISHDHMHVTWTCVWGGARGCASCAVRLRVCENSDGWLAAWDLRECMLVHSSTVRLLPVTLW